MQKPTPLNGTFQEHWRAGAKIRQFLGDLALSDLRIE
jgi:hypothetical protein